MKNLLFFGLIFFLYNLSSSFASTQDERDGANFMSSKGYIMDYSSDPEKYRLNDSITRREIMKIIINISGSDMGDTCKSIFSDIKDTDWGCKYIMKAYNLGYITNNSTFRPDDNVSKIEALKMLFKVLGIKKLFDTGDWKADYVKTAYTNKWYKTEWTNYTQIESRGWVFMSADRIINNLQIESMKDTANKEIITVYSSPSAEKESERLGQDFPHSSFKPTGYFVPANTLIGVKVKNYGKDFPTLLIGTYSRYEENQNPQYVELEEGYNMITSEKGGLLYIRYSSDLETEVSRSEIIFTSNMIKAPYFKEGETTNLDWKNQLINLSESPDVIVEGERVILVFSREKALEWQDENYDKLLKSYTDILDAYDSISGIDDSKESDRKNTHKLLLTETDIKSAYMFATSYRTAFKSEVSDRPFTKMLYSSDGWGVWHEIGHMYQQLAWMWEPLTEVTVNIYSLTAQRMLGYPSRLIEDDIWKTQVVPFFEREQEKRDFNDDTQIDVFGRLYMFEQLRQTFGDDLYIQLHKNTRTELPQFKNDTEKMSYFMVQISTISGKDMTDFFRKWGFIGTDDGYEKIKNLNLPKPETDISLLQVE